MGNKLNKNMRLIFQTLTFLLISTVLQAQTSDTIYLWPDKVPNEKMEKHPPVQTDNTKGDVTRITDITNPALVVFEPKNSNNLGVGVIVCPGGGYNILAIDKEGYEIAEWLNGLGYTAFVLQYRVPDNQLGALNDIQRAIRIVRSEVNHYHLNPEKIGIIGFSAGGSLVARASTLFTNASYTKVDTLDKLSCKPNFSMLVYPAYLDKGEDRSITPELVLSKDVPPFFIFGTSDDYFGNSSLVFTQALRDNKTPVELHLLQNGGHGYGLRPGNVAAITWPSLAEVWLNMTIKSINIIK
jgi:acetyl esterase/lipase